MRIKINKKKVKKIAIPVIAVILVLTIIAGVVAFIANYPDERTAEFSGEAKTVEKATFDEGEFTMGKYDLIVSLSGDDNAEGTLEAPLKSLKGAKEKVKTLNVPENEKITVWFREGTYEIFETVSFDRTDKSNVLYRSYPNEKVEFTGSKEVKGNWEKTKINNVEAFVTDMPVESDDDYFRSMFKDGKRLSRPNYPKTDVFKV